MVGLTREKALKENLIDKAYEKWTKLEEKIKVITNLYDPVKTTRMCLVPNI
jgi:hypothetical protein